MDRLGGRFIIKYMSDILAIIIWNKDENNIVINKAEVYYFQLFLLYTIIFGCLIIEYIIREYFFKLKVISDFKGSEGRPKF